MISYKTSRLQTEEVKSQEDDLEKGLSTQKGQIGSELKDITLVSKSGERFFSREETIDFLKSAKDMTENLNEKHVYGNGLNSQSRFISQGINNLKEHILGLSNLKDKSLANEDVLYSEKWVINEVCDDLTILPKGFNDKEIEEAVNYLENSLGLNQVKKEEMLALTVEYLIDIQTKRNQDPELKKHNYRNKIKEKHEKMFNYFKQSHNQISTLNTSFGKERKENEIIDKENIYTQESSDDKKFQSCGICYENIQEMNGQPILKCGHIFCLSCYRSYMQERIYLNKIIKVSCPQFDCLETLEDSHFQAILSPEKYGKYQRLKKILVLNKNPNLRWCVRNGCENYAIGKPGCKKVICECRMEICFNCNNEYHPFQSCESVVDKVYQRYAKKNNIKSCPQCKYKVEKDGGCDHMTCGKCSYQWCWLCGSKYTSDHFAKNKCPKIKKSKQARNQNIKRSSYFPDIRKDPILILAIPVTLTFLSLLLPYRVYGTYMKKKHRRSIQFANLRPITVIFLTLLALILFPLSFFLMFNFFIYEGFMDIWSFFRERKTRNSLGKVSI